MAPYNLLKINKSAEKMLETCASLLKFSELWANCRRHYDKLTIFKKLSFKTLLLSFSWEKQFILFFAPAFGGLTEA